MTVFPKNTCNVHATTDEPVRKLFPLLIFLLSIGLHNDVAADPSVVAGVTSAAEISGIAVADLNQSSTVNMNQAAQFVTPALESSSTSAGVFDPSLILVLMLGIGGLVWMRRSAAGL